MKVGKDTEEEEFIEDKTYKKKVPAAWSTASSIDTGGIQM